MNSPDFLICAPLQVANMSNGVLGMIQLAKTIEKLGRNAYMCQIMGLNDELICMHDLNTYVPPNEEIKAQIAPVLSTAKKLGAKIFGEYTREKIDASYVVYPESVLGNPLGAKNVVRFFGNRDGALKNGAKVKRGENDFLLTQSRVIMSDAHHVCCFAWINPLFNRSGSRPTLKRTLDLSYVGKGSLFGFNGRVENTIAITRFNPRSKDELAIMLRECRFFYTADACSNINNEALSCGAMPVFLHNGPWTDAEIDAFEAGAMPRLHLDEPLDDARFERFERSRDTYLAKLADIEQRWEPSVGELIDKVDRHFAAGSHTSDSALGGGGGDLERRDGMRTHKGATINPSLSRKDRRRWKGVAERPHS